MSTIQQITKDARGAMEKSLESSKRELSSIRTGKASVSLLDTIRVEVYGQTMLINQVASVSAPEPRMLTVQPFDKGLATAVEKAIRDAGMGLNPATQGAIIRVPLPQLTEERRKELVKLVHKLAEEGRVAVRQARGEAHTKVKKLQGLPEDDVKRAEKEVQKLTDDAVRQVDQLVGGKEKELMEV